MALCLSGLLIAALSPLWHPSQATILSEDFSGGIGPAWTQSATAKGTVTVRDGALQIATPRNTFAHLYRKLDLDNVTAQARIKPAEADSWATSIFLYWGPGDWVQLGVRPMDGGRIYTTKMVVGGYSEANLGRTPFDAWHYVRLELGGDVVRFYSSDDAKAWRLERFEERPGSFVGAPKLLFVGKGFGGMEGYPNPMLANDYKEPGEMGTSLIDDVLVIKTPAAKVNANAKETASWKYALEDGLGKRFLNQPGGPTYESIASVLPGIRYSRETVGVPEHPQDIGIEADGSIQLGGYEGYKKDPVLYLEVGDPPVRVGSAQVPVRKKLSALLAPIVRMDFAYGGLKYTARVFGYSENGDPDKPLSVYLGLYVQNSTGAGLPFRFRIRLDPEKPGSAPFEWVGTAPPAKSAAEASSVAAHFRAPLSDAWSGVLTPGADPDFQSALRNSLALWESKWTLGTVMGLPEKRLEDAYVAWLNYNYLNVDKRNGQYEIHDGSGFYEEMYGYSVALFINALDLYGKHKDAEKYLDSWLSFQQPDGLLTANYGLPDMGATLLVMSEHYRYTGDKAWLKRVAPKMVKIFGWLKAKRAECMATQKPTDVVYGLIKYRPYCDYPDPAYDYVGDAYAVVGMEATARVFREIGIADRASHIASEAAAYRKDIVTSMNRGLLHRYGMSILDMEPETHRLLKRSQYKGGEYYGLIAPQLLETGFLDPKGRLAKIVTDFMEKRGGFLCGMSEFQGGVDHAYTYGYWLNRLQNGEPDKAVLGLYASMAGAISRETHSGVEVMHLMTGEPERTLPHTYSGTQQLRILRMMMMREEGDSLIVGQGFPRGWLGSGKDVKIEEAPTLFGPMNVSYRSYRSNKSEPSTIEAALTPSFRHAPKTVKLWFRNPKNLPLKSVTLNGKPYRNFKGQVVTLKGSIGKATVIARF